MWLYQSIKAQGCKQPSKCSLYLLHPRPNLPLMATRFFDRKRTSNALLQKRVKDFTLQTNLKTIESEVTQLGTENQGALRKQWTSYMQVARLFAQAQLVLYATIDFSFSSFQRNISHVNSIVDNIIFKMCFKGAMWRYFKSFLRTAK